MGDLILLRGLPGSGKSTLAKILSENGLYPYFSVDDYFTNPETGEYSFAFEQNHIAYKQCEENTRLKMTEASARIIIHNTFTMEWELKPYFELAKEYGYRVFVATVENRHGSESVHAIPREQLEKMAEKYKVVLV